MSRASKLGIAALVVAIVLAIAAIAARRVAVQLLRKQVVAALGPGSEVSAVHVGTSRVEVDGLHILGPPDWPAPDALRAERVRIAPSLLTLRGPEIDIASIEVSKPYVSALRTRDDGLRLLPSLLERPETARASEPPPTPARSVVIRDLSIEDGALDLFDATVARTPWRIQLVQVQAQVHDVEAPGLSRKIPFELDAVLLGPTHNGTLSLRGANDAAAPGELLVDVKERGADLLALQPYLLRSGGAQLSGGTLDLDLDVRVRARKLHAPGKLALIDLAFAPGADAREKVFGVPLALLTRAIEARNGRIEVAFTLEGDIDDPEFSLNEVFATRVALQLAETLGLSVEGLVEGVGTLGGKSLEGAGKAARGLAPLLKGLLPERDH
jgi:hypothetical protein